MTVMPLPAPGRTAVRITGDHYQWLVAWHGCVIALHEHAQHVPNPILAVGVEVDDAGNLDDVVLWRRSPPHTYSQVKYAVDSTTPVDTEFLTAPSKSGGPSILRKIATTWARLTQNDELVDLVLITNRAPDPTDPIIAARDARTRLLLPKAAEQTASSARGRTRTAWAAAAGLAENDLLSLLAVLRFDTARDLEHVHEKVSLQMLAAGLRGDPSAVRAGADWVAEQVANGQRRLDLDMIRGAIDQLGLRVGRAHAILSIATLKPDPLAAEAAYGIDWVERFDGESPYAKRRPKPPATWHQLQQDIDEIPRHLTGLSQVALTGSLRQATAFATGAALRMVTNIDLAVVQRDQLWESTASYDGPTELTAVEHELELGDDLAIAIEVATPITDDVLDFIHGKQVPIRRLIVLRPPGGPKDNSVGGSVAANALAVGIRNHARRAVKGHPRIHLFLAGPMGLSLLLGHRWNRVAPTVVYEDLGAALSYDAAFTISA